MLRFIAPIALMVLGTVLALTHFSTASGLRRAFLRVPETIIRALREGVPARVTGTIAAIGGPLTPPLGAHPSGRFSHRTVAHDVLGLYCGGRCRTTPSRPTARKPESS